MLNEWKVNRGTLLDMGYSLKGETVYIDKSCSPLFKSDAELLPDFAEAPAGSLILRATLCNEVKATKIDYSLIRKENPYLPQQNPAKRRVSTN